MTGMLVNSNDSFFLLLNEKIPDSGDVAAQADAWDAGTEENNENCTEVPGPACDHAGIGSVDEGGVIHNSMVSTETGVYLPAPTIGEIQLHQWQSERNNKF